MGAIIHKFLQAPMTGVEIETASFGRIDREVSNHGYNHSEWMVVRRMVHATADFGFIGPTRFSKDAIAAGCKALSQGRRLFVDSNMIRAGLSIGRLGRLNKAYGPDSILCHVADRDVAQMAAQEGLPRSLFAVRKACKQLEGAIVAIGNSPVALMELNRLVLEDGLRPALVVGMPVGFIHVEESKAELATLDVSHIVALGPRGGSPVAVSVLHALCTLATC